MPDDRRTTTQATGVLPHVPCGPYDSDIRFMDDDCFSIRPRHMDVSARLLYAPA